MQHPANGSHPIPPLPAGTLIGDYRIVSCQSSETDGNTYLARTPDQATYQVLEYPAGQDRPLSTLAALHLEHPALLAPAPPLAQGERQYIAFPSPPRAQPLAALPPDEVLRQVIAIGEALEYLHSRGVAHLHVHPDSLLLVDGRATLGGLAHAQPLRPDDENTPLLFARDANFLALTLGALVARQQPSNQPPQPTEDSLAHAIGQIQTNGANQAYRSVTQVIADCQHALAQEPAPTPQSQPPPPHWTITSGQATSVGRVRTSNEDALGALQLQLEDISGQPLQLACFIVADGAGGEEQGEIASRLATQYILEQIVAQIALPLLQQSPAQTTPDWRERQMREALVAGFRAANRQIRALSAAHSQTMATTATALLLLADQAFIAHVGDSRAYCWQDGRLTTLTEDHSYVQRLIQLGQLDPADQATHPRRNALYRCLGQRDQLEVDVIPCPLAGGERLLLCTDGLWEAVGPDTLARLLATDSPQVPPAAIASQLVTLADEAGGADNSTAIVIAFEREE